MVILGQAPATGPFQKKYNNEIENKIMTAPMNQRYMLIFRGTEWYKGLSPEQMQQVMDEWMGWFKRLTDEGTVLGGDPLEREGKIVSGKNGQVIADGPFAEAKETIGGYFMLQVETMDEAVAVAKQCPGLPYGIRVEVRAVAEMCPVAKDLPAKAALQEA
jgi:hypothetical protein